MSIRQCANQFVPFRDGVNELIFRMKYVNLVSLRILIILFFYLL